MGPIAMKTRRVASLQHDIITPMTCETEAIRTIRARSGSTIRRSKSPRGRKIRRIYLKT